MRFRSRGRASTKGRKPSTCLTLAAEELAALVFRGGKAFRGAGRISQIAIGIAHVHKRVVPQLGVVPDVILGNAYHALVLLNGRPQVAALLLIKTDEQEGARIVGINCLRGAEMDDGLIHLSVVQQGRAQIVFCYPVAARDLHGVCPQRDIVAPVGDLAMRDHRQCDQ